MHCTNYNINKISKNEVDILVLYYLNNWFLYYKKRDQHWGNYEVSKLCDIPQKRVSKLVILIHFINMHISRSKCFMSSGSYTVWKGWNWLVHCVTLHCLQLSTFFMIFMPSHPQSCLTGYFRFLGLFDERWLLRHTINRQPGRWIATGIRSIE